MKNEGGILTEAPIKIPHLVGTQETRLEIIATTRYSWAGGTIRILFSSLPLPGFIMCHRLDWNAPPSNSIATNDDVLAEGAAS